jgi:septal ring factor EnvC (AmiA/AmiB activator)
MSEFKAITTQEEFDKAIQERLARQKESIEKQYADYAEIKARNTELETEIGALKTTLSETNGKTESYDKDIAELNAKIAGYETANIRTRIALQHGIPYDLAGRLVGEDEESITADAKKLAELVGKKEPIAPLKDTEPPVDDKDGAYKSLLENLNLEGE